MELPGFMPRQRIAGTGSTGMKSEMALSQQQLQKMWPRETIESKTCRCAELREFCPAKFSYQFKQCCANQTRFQLCLDSRET